jgi:hypothetical protein
MEVLTLDWQSFGCCSGWIFCPQVGYCTSPHREEYLRKCSLANLLFIKEDPKAIEGWKETAKAHTDKYRATFDFNQPDYDTCQRVISQIRATKTFRSTPAPTTQETYTPRKVQQVEFSKNIGGLLVQYLGGGFEMKGAKVVTGGNYYELVSWMFRDLVHYGIRQKDTFEIVEQFSPTKELKGWELRNYVMQVHKEHEQRGVPKETLPQVQKPKRSLVTRAKEVEVGHILVWPNAKGTALYYAKVVKLSEHLVHYVKHTGDGFCWAYDVLDDYLQDGVVKVVLEDEVPEGTIFVAKAQ